MTTTDVSAKDLLMDMGQLMEVIRRLTPTDLSELLSMRFRISRALGSFLDGVDDRCLDLRGGPSPQAQRCSLLQGRVALLRNRVSAHVARWSPAAIATDMQGYKSVVLLLQREIRAIITEVEGLTCCG